MAVLACCIGWFVGGVLVGWLASWWLSKKLRTADTSTMSAAVTAMPSSNTTGVDFRAASLAGFDVKGLDDLRIIEGIGPRIAELLKAAGIATFAQLAATEVPAIQAVLDRGGARFKLARPQTWPEQAALAAANRWSELLRLQDELDGGVRTPGDGPLA